MTKRFLPYGLVPHEIGFLILLGAAFFVSAPAIGPKPWQSLLFGAAVIAAVPVLIYRCRDEWARLPNRAFFFVLAAAWVALFVFLGVPTFDSVNPASLPRWMFEMYTVPLSDDGHGLLIPFVVLALYWWKRKELVAQPAGLWWPAIGWVALALALHIVGFLSQQQRLSVMGFFLGLYALTGLAWGRHWWKASFFPFFLLAFCIPVAQFADPLTMPLRLLVSRIVEVIAHLGLSPDLVRDGTRLMDGQRTFAYEVAAPCSGIHSLVALLALNTIYGFINFQAPWKRAAMMVIALPLSVLGNVVRLCFTVGVAEAFGQDAGKAVETKFGFITFAVAVGGAFLIARWLEKFPAEAKTKPAPPALAQKPLAS